MNEDKLREAFEAGYRRSQEDTRNEGTPYPYWGPTRGFEKWLREQPKS